MTELDIVRSQVPAIQRGCYFNGGYTGPLCSAARTAADEVTWRECENGRMGRAARAASAAITSEAQAKVARLLKVPAAGIALTQHTADGMNISSGERSTARVYLDAVDVPTLVPTLAAVALSLSAGMELTGAAHLVYHKTSRLDLTIEGLLATLGVDVDSDARGLDTFPLSADANVR